MLRVAIVILALCAVTVPNVFAECAWILWEKTEEGRESIERVFSLAQGQGWFWVRSQHTLPGDYCSITRNLADGGIYTSSHSFYCLPETIDPRHK